MGEILTFVVSTSTRTAEPLQAKAQVISGSSSGSRLALDDTFELYPDLGVNTSTLATAMSLLREAQRLLSEAKTASDDEDMILADDAVQRFQALLPELFCCRSLGDSYATIINALTYGLQNLRGTPVSSQQVSAALFSVDRLIAEPFLSYEAALGISKRLEDSGLRLEPVALANLAEWLLG